MKILFFDGSGLCLFYKRLDRRTFRVPEPREGRGETVVEIDEGALEDLLEGIEVGHKEPRRRRASKTAVH